MTITSNCVLTYPLTHTQCQATFHADPPILCPCHDVLFYIVERHGYRLWSWTLLLLIWASALVSYITFHKLYNLSETQFLPLNSGILLKVYFENAQNKVPITQFIFSKWYYQRPDYLFLCLFNEGICYLRTKTILIIL